jgi:UrcA family protein
MNSSIAKRWAHLAVATLATGLIVNHAWAAEAPDEVARSVVVRYADLDLSSPKDAHTLYDRLHAAARSVCTNIGVQDSDLASLAQYHRCIQQAMANAVANVGSKRLAEIHACYIHACYNR